MIKTKLERLVYENKYVRVFDDDVVFPDGHEGTYFRTRWKAPHGVVVAPVRGDEVLLIWNHRYAYPAPSLEVPQGFGVYGADLVADAKRELMEETGCTAIGIEHLVSYGGPYKDHLFEAILPDNAEPTARNAESTESITGFQWLPIADICPTKFASLGIIDQPTMTALLLVKIRRSSRLSVTP